MIRKRSVLTEKKMQGHSPKSHRCHHPEGYTSTVFTLKRQGHLTQAERSPVCRHIEFDPFPHFFMFIHSLFFCVSLGVCLLLPPCLFSGKVLFSDCFQGCIVCDSKEVLVEFISEFQV